MAETLAFVIHQRPYQEHDTIVSLFTERYGLLPVFIKGSRGASLSSQHLRACLQPATLLDVDVLTSGHSLSQLRHVDSLSITPPLTSIAFVYLSYINEITRLFLNENSSVPEVFSA
ncbi:MAG: DNA repair protein RecO, partial [Sinobacterium sp.]|nr:DNA repair protein RecO [Sinobacterium sp.]